MKISSTILFTALVCNLLSWSLSYGQFQYVSPKPGSMYHNPKTNIILKNGNFIDERSLDPSLVTIVGSSSGLHSSRIVLSDDGKTIVIYPSSQFAGDEQVNVTVSDGFQTKNGDLIKGTSFDFSIHRTWTPADLASISGALKYSKDQEYEGTGIEHDSKGEESTERNCSIPDFTITSSGNEYAEEVFYFNQKASGGGCWGRTILSNAGDSIFAEFDTERGISWTINHNGYLTYYSYIDSSFEMMDTMYNVVKKFYMGNGYRADEHEFLVFPDGHYFMMCYDVIPNLDLSALGGLDTVDVTGCVIQELDANDNVIFQWRSWDYMEYDDAIFWVQNLLPGNSFFDWIHANSLELDYDGNLMLSSRHLCEITKIDLSTGEMIWRWGGDNNEFTFVNDIDTLLYFSGQHDFRRLPNGDYTMFNNGNGFNPATSNSRAKQYNLDQTNKIATMTWQYTHPQVNGLNLYTPAMGSVQRLPNGNTFIDWGLVSSAFDDIPRFTEVDPNDNIVWEFNFAPTDYYICYRAYKFDWNRCPPPMDSTFALTFISSDSAELTWNVPNFNSSFIFQYKLSSASVWISVPVVSNTISLDNLTPNSLYDWRVQSVCTVFDDSSSYSGIEQFNTLPVGGNVDAEDFSSLEIYPNPVRDVMHVFFGSKTSIPVTLTITNLPGEVIYQESWMTSNGQNQKTIEIGTLPKGVYLVQLQSEEFSVQRRIVIQ